MPRKIWYAGKLSYAEEARAVSILKQQYRDGGITEICFPEWAKSLGLSMSLSNSSIELHYSDCPDKLILVQGKRATSSNAQRGSKGGSPSSDYSTAFTTKKPPATALAASNSYSVPPDPTPSFVTANFAKLSFASIRDCLWCNRILKSNFTRRTHVGVFHQ